MMDLLKLLLFVVLLNAVAIGWVLRSRQRLVPKSPQFCAAMSLKTCGICMSCFTVFYEASAKRHGDTACCRVGSHLRIVEQLKASRQTLGAAEVFQLGVNIDKTAGARLLCRRVWLWHPLPNIRPARLWRMVEARNPERIRNVRWQDCVALCC